MSRSSYFEDDYSLRNSSAKNVAPSLRGSRPDSEEPLEASALENVDGPVGGRGGVVKQSTRRQLHAPRS